MLKLAVLPFSHAQVVENEELQATLVRFRHQLEGLLAAYEACRDARKSTGLLDCLNVLCEDLGQAGFRVPDSGRLTTDVRTDFPVTDAYESGREEATNWTGADGLEVGSKEAPKPSGNGSLGASEKGPDAAEENLDAKARGLDAVEGGSDAEEGGSDASHVVSDREESEEPAESAHRTRSGRKSAAPSAWWAVVDQEKDKQERVAKRKASESVRKRESASEKRPKVAAATEMALVEQGGELAEIDLEEEERR